MTPDLIRLPHHTHCQIAEYERTAWFVLGYLQREGRLNMEAMASSPFAALTWMTAMQPLFYLHLISSTTSTREPDRLHRLVDREGH